MIIINHGERNMRVQTVRSQVAEQDGRKAVSVSCLQILPVADTNQDRP